ncbi:MAG: GDP-mannose 4,6-dehydratase [Gammaproteobacteria bacterium TMED281]|nr:MAG: GDP-mannose 4,6-dehydratase [Gammaproteobacteria bacterium TMED281]|tara:strand:- start:2059 stop:3174 length:1116 start_codon:yes stop_codon:yes gene_type:complete
MSIKSRKKKKALITGITGQDGSYLAEFLIDKGYEVHGLKRRSSSFNTKRIDHIYEDPHTLNKKLILHDGDLTDSSSVVSVISDINPDEIYNLGAQSHVATSFKTPEYTSEVDALGTLRILEAIRFLGLRKKVKFYQASTSELYGLVQETPQKETTPFYPRSPYAVAKLFSYWITINYREAYGIYACNGILFNHESERRGETFVTRKITRALSRIFYGLEDCLYLGNLDSQRDWGHAKDYVEMQWLMLQQKKPNDYVISSGEQHSVRSFVEKAAFYIGLEISWKNSGINEVGYVKKISDKKNKILKDGDEIIRIDSNYFRPTEVDSLLGDSSKAKKELGWEPKISFDRLIEEMMQNDMSQAKKEVILKKEGY